MNFEYTPEQEALRMELRAALEEVMTPERREALAGHLGGGALVSECRRDLGRAGLLGVGWPKEWGGRGLSQLEQFIFLVEAKRVRAPLPMITLNAVGPTLMRFGSDEQKKTFLPGILD